MSERTECIDIISNVTLTKWSTTWRPHHKNIEKGNQPSGGETLGQILERHDLTEDSTREGNLEVRC